MKKHNIHAEGGSLGSAWDSLSMADKSKVIEWAVKNGITNMEDIKKAYEEYVANASSDEDNAAPQGPTDEQYPEQYPQQDYPDYGEYQQEPEYITPEEEYSFAEGGELGTSGSYTKALFSNLFDLKYGNPSSHYNNVDTALMHRLAPDSRGHYSDIVKLPNHPTSPARGTFFDNNRYYGLSEKGMEDPNYTLFGMVDNGDGATTLRYGDTYVLPEPTVTPQGNYYDDTYDNVKLYYEPPKKLAGGGFLIGLGHPFGEGGNKSVNGNNQMFTFGNHTYHAVPANSDLGLKAYPKGMPDGTNYWADEHNNILWDKNVAKVLNMAYSSQQRNSNHLPHTIDEAAVTSQQGTTDKSSNIALENASRFLGNVLNGQGLRGMADGALWLADKLGAPSNATNFLRDLNVSVPYRATSALRAGVNTLLNNRSFGDNYREALHSPSFLERLLTIHPLINTNSNFNNDELNVIYKMAGDKGYIENSDIKRYSSDGKYGSAGTISSYFTSPSKVVQTALGQMSHDPDGYLQDLYDFNTQSQTAKHDNAMYTNNALSNPGINYQTLRAVTPFIGTIDIMPDEYKIQTKISRSE